MRWVLILAAIGLMGCAKGGGGGSASPTPGPSQHGLDQGAPSCGSMPACSAIESCKQTCFAIYPYQDPRDITSDCAARGILYSGICDALLAKNQEAYNDYVECISKPANHVIQYSVSCQ